MSTQALNHDEIVDKFKNQGMWVRLLYMLLYGALLHIAGTVMWLSAVAQFIFVLLCGHTNQNLLNFNRSLISFIKQALEFVSFATDDKPFPFKAWPKNEASEVEEAIIVKPENSQEQGGA